MTLTTAAKTLSPREMEAKCLDRYASLTGAERNDAIKYMQGVISGRYGTTSQAGRDYARRCLDAMPAEPDPCPICGGDCAGANPPVANCPLAA